ncbi:MAG TPA: Ig domain-containing protein, partial [Leptospiraceae bacterium]|nr:Ig domain-containing protein [Leptospiraceae bacterium]
MERVQKIAVSILIISVFSVGCGLLSSKKDDTSSKNLLIGAAALNASKNTVAVPSGLSYSGSPFSFLQKTAITTVTPALTGTVTVCTSSPALPTGLSLDAPTCALSGTPTTVQSSASYTITATNSAGNTTTSISILVSSDASGWTVRTLPSSSIWQSMTYGNGVFVAV